MIQVNQKVRLKNLPDDFSFLNGKTGTTTIPFQFGFSTRGMVGIFLDSDNTYDPKPDMVNVKESEIEILN